MAKKRIKDLGATAAVSDLKAGNYFVVDGDEGTKKFNALYFQNLMLSFAPVFDKTRTSSNPYKVGDYVTYQCRLYRFTTTHYGGWDGSHASAVSAYELTPFFGGITGLGYSSISELNKDGFYRIDSSEIQQMTDVPDDYISGSLILFVQKISGTYVQQLLRDNNGRQWYRNVKITDGTAGDWIRQAYFLNVISSPTSFESYRYPGSYNVLPGVISDFSDKPASSDIIGHCVLMVFPLSANFNFQVLWSSAKNRIYTRKSALNSSVSSSAWQCTNWSSASISELGVTKIESCEEDGAYNCESAYTSELEDLPTDYESGSFILFVKAANVKECYQELKDLRGNGWWRYSKRSGTTGTTSPWVKLNSTSTISKTKWLAMGDSRTRGVYSTEGGSSHITEKNYPYYVAKLNGYDVTNVAVGGSGYVHKPSDSPSHANTYNAKEYIDSGEIDFTEYDLVTLDWGVNDWHYEMSIGSWETSTVGDGTMVGNMRYVIEKILEQNPYIKIIVITPYNATQWGGDSSTNWAYGDSTTFPTAGTLKSIVDKEIQVCEYYGIDYVDSSKVGIVNRVNAEEWMPDGLHVAEPLYENIGRLYSKYIKFG